MHIGSNFRRYLLCGVAVAGFHSGLAHAAETATEEAGQTEEIIVTAQRRAERLQDVPITITNVSAATMRQANITQLADITKVTSGVRFDSRYSYFTPTIRGISTSNYLPGSPSNVALYLDGFASVALASANFQLMNIDSIQVLKGPQGTLFGRNTTAGAVLVNTAKPSTETKAVVEASYGTYNARRLQGYVTTGLSDRIAVDLAAQVSAGDGWFKNIFTGDDNPGKYRNVNVRAGLNVEVSDNFSLLFRYEYASSQRPDGFDVERLCPSGQGRLRQLREAGGRHCHEAWRDFRGRAPEFPSVTPTHTNSLPISISVFQISHPILSIARTIRNSSTPLDLTSVAVTAQSTKEKDKLFTQEFILNSKPGTPFQWTTGAYYSNWSSQWPYVGLAPAGVVSPPSPYPQLLESGIKSESYAVFGDATYEIVDHLFLTAGLRYTHDALKDAYSNFLAIGPRRPPTLTTSRLTPRGVIRYEISDESSIYASVSRGYKAAIYNISSTSTPGTPILPEEIWAYEAGYKYSSRTLSLNLSGYYYDYTNQQLAQSRLINGIATTFITNAASSTLYGIDADINYQVTDRLSLNVGGEWSHARYKDFPGAPSFNLATFLATGTFVNVLVDASGGQMTRAPDYTVNAGAAYKMDLAGGTFTLSGNLFYSSRFYFDLAQRLPQKGYATLDLRAEWTDPSDRYTLAVAGKNVTDTHYLIQASQNGLGIGAGWGAPAQVEASVRVKF